MFRKYIVLWLTTAISFTAIFTATACPLHFGYNDSEQGMIPGAQTMKSATIFYTKHGDIKEPASLLPAATFQRASWWLTLLAKELQSTSFNSAYILLIDIPLWSQIDLNRSNGISIDVPQPETPDNTILMTQASLNAIISNQITIADAIDMGLISFHNLDTHIMDEVRKLPRH
ncbi:hypothetical protein MACH09_15210 [Vibrio sp. MACH09]|uniref:hypothetical protein n=1 Tax=Vibrio sp. MACH09 TaxID=3025122 RepID=UPI002793A731|nr:hypothetical protein [Vibrio sp. MACH09]GLO61013.1 hypothetical protein MACH09_15210 [Vibrio sp. MACH09]